MLGGWTTIESVALLAMILVSGCSDEGPAPRVPTGPDTPMAAPPEPPTTISIVSGETGAPVAGARAVVAGRELTADPTGRLTLEARPSDGTEVDIVAGGFFTRVTYFGSPGGTTFSLWPLRSPIGLDEETTLRLVYTSTASDAVPGLRPLLRPSAGMPLVLSPDVAITESARAMRAIESAAGALERALGGRLSVVIERGAAGAPGTPVEIRLDADVTSSDFVGRWERSTGRDGTITRARLTFRSLSRLIDNESLIVHNLGHAVGLNHSLDPNDRMLEAWWTRRAPDFSAKEGVVMRLMFERRPGNRFPDTDRGASAIPLGARAILSGVH